MPLIKTVGPLLLTTNLTTNIYNQNLSGLKAIVRTLHICNETVSAATFSLWKGLTGANTVGTALFRKKSVPANDTLDFPFPFEMLTTDFLVGGADVTSNALSLMLTIELVPV
jgi:hypothetical protein